MNLSEWFEARPKAFVVSCAVVLVGIIGLIDYVTGYEIALSVYYLIPIALASWYVSRGAGIFISVASTVTEYITDYYAGQVFSDPVVAYWNVAATLAFFLVVNFILSAMKKAFEEVSRSARTEPLTGLSNMRAFYEVAENELNRARRYNTVFSLAYIDLDNFKAVNDVLGHSTGDVLLRSVAKTLLNRVRTTDLVGRLGGDEFVILFPETNYEQVKAVVGRIQHHLLEVMRDSGWAVTFSMGVITFIESPQSVNEMIRIADSLMYAAKNAGKNRASFEMFPHEPQAVNQLFDARV
ncbi:MAG TPA: GGDEF domain-containing protein [Desulfomonilaceae bacterium]|nr:GGDEF domain-containing protein [Desulfomonilaceae bacterium]